MGRDRKRVVFLVFEGQSDLSAFFIPISRMFEEIDKEIIVIYGFIDDKDQEKGDITSKYGIKPENIEEIMTKIIFKPYLNREGLYPKDLLKVIQIVDIDGAYVPDEMIAYDAECVKTKYADKIYTDDIDKIIDRNRRKRDNLNYLTSISEIKVSSKKIPYEVYYSSTNLEHVISNMPNYEESKNDNAKRFCSNTINSTKQFRDFFMSVNPSIKDLSYEKSWEFIKQDDNSLKRFSNLSFLFSNNMNIQ